MQRERPYVITIAGLDPSSGAGLTADLKTFEQLKVYGLAVCTAYTLQTHDTFHNIEWRDEKKILEETATLLNTYPVEAVKTGILPSTSLLEKLVTLIRAKDERIRIIVDPVWKSSTGFEFNPDALSEKLLSQITLLTPNLPELDHLGYAGDPDKILGLSNFTHVLLKGGHHPTKAGTDILYCGREQTVIPSSKGEVKAKHGSGCVLSSAITAYLALGYDIKAACTLAKKYMDRFLTSTENLLGYHAS
jgi:hydroxymethylpyrimidine/phosphomethylpyrimidine kinase